MAGHVVVIPMAENINVFAKNVASEEVDVQYKTTGTYRPIGKDDKKITKRERRLGRVVVNKQVNYTAKEWKAKKRAEAEARNGR